MLRPTGNRVIIQRIEDSGVTKGGIHLPDNAKEKPRRGKVLAVGPGVPNVETGKLLPVLAVFSDNYGPDADEGFISGVGVGEVVVFGAYAGTEVKEDGKDYLILNADEILAVVE